MKSSVSSSATVAWNLCLTWEQFEFAVDVSDACDIKMSAIRVYDRGNSGSDPEFPRKTQNISFSANWICREAVAVLVISPADSL